MNKEELRKSLALNIKEMMGRQSVFALSEAIIPELQEGRHKPRKCSLCSSASYGYVCKFCLADELYTRRKTMQFMKLDLCVQAAVCLIAKSAASGAQARGAKSDRIVGAGYSSIGTLTRRLPDCIIYDEIETLGDSDNDNS